MAVEYKIAIKTISYKQYKKFGPYCYLKNNDNVNKLHQILEDCNTFPHCSPK